MQVDLYSTIPPAYLQLFPCEILDLVHIIFGFCTHEPLEGHPVSEPQSVLLSLQAAILRNDLQTIDELMAHLDRLSANEALRQLGEEWGFPTGEVVGFEDRVMLLKDLAKLTYGYEDTTPLRSLLRRYGRKPLGLKVYDHDRRKQLRQIFGGGDEGGRLPALATWSDVLIIGMRGQTDAILDILADHIRHEETSEIRAYVLQTLRDHNTRPYASVTEGNAMGQELARVIAEAQAGQVAMACREG